MSMGRGNVDVRGKVLVVEDDESLATFLKQSLEEQFEVAVAHDGLAGYELACTFQPDCILSDVRMPKLSGINMVKKIRRTPGLETVGIIMLSVLREKEDRIRGYENLADLYFGKPFEMDEILVSIMGLITMRKQMKQAYAQQITSESSAVGEGLTDDDMRFLVKLSDAVKERISDHELTVETIARAVHVSKRNLERRLKDLEGISPSVYIRQVRLEEARKLLLSGSISSITDLAYRVGFKDSKHFSKQFTNYFGLSPSSLL